ncbi:MAG: glycosyl hydrolase family 18 protein [Romboutsia sp.]|uniref:glycosyl hydrolase family 18 protein n=1 Tax=Romboutsia sp. TaxID=1965302 RepID=UPI003F373100
MKNRKKIYFILIILFVGIFILIYKNHKIDSIKTKEDISAWIVDWDLERGLEETKNLGIDFTSTQVFAAYFDENENIFVPNNLLDSNYKDLDKVYITVVNDIVKKDGSSIHKDSEIIKNILMDSKKSKFHIEDLVNLVCEGGFYGLDLDYEKIDDDMWDEYVIFIDKLGKELKKRDKELRVILEPRSPIDKVNLPNDYEYVMMAYNLYGYHSGPGPKADKKFIKKLSHSTNNNTTNVRMAFSLGGFDWCEKDNPKPLTNTEAKELLKKTKSEEYRDEKSGTLNFNYIDSDGKKHQVWYSDETTIKIWINVAKENGISKFALWRLGGNI